MKKLFTFFLLAFLPLVANADCVEINGVYYNLNSENQTAEVTYSSGKYSGDVVIVASVTHNEVAYSVTSIGISAFFGCSDLTSVTIPNSVTTICREAFSHCSGLTSVTIPNSVTTIDYWAFRYCSGLTSVTIGNSVTSIGFQAFYECSGLTSVTIPNSVTSIGDGAFSECSGLISVTIPNSVISIGDSAFRGCSALASVTIPNSVTSIDTAVFQYCRSLSSVTIPNSVTSIGQAAFDGCRGLASVTIPNSVTSIGQAAFSGCRGLASVTIPNSVTSIGKSAFYYCDGMTSVTIGNSVTSIGAEAFQSCNSLTSVHISDIAAWCKISFITVDSNPLDYAHHLYLNGEEITDLVIPYSVTSIGDYAFYDCDGLASVTIPNSVTSIGDYAFYDCDGLTSVTIPNSVTSIGKGTFAGCSGLTSVIIGTGVTSIGFQAFAYCGGLTDFYCYAENVPETESRVFDYTKIANATLHVPEGSVEAYSTTEPWSGFGNIVAITDEQGYVVFDSETGTLTFMYGKKPTGDNVYDLNEGDNTPGWSESDEVTKAVFDASFAKVRPTTTYKWFSRCRSLEEIQGIEYLNTSNVEDMRCMFSYCEKLKALDVSHFDTKKVKDMNYMFCGCTGLTSLDLSNFDTSNVTDMHTMFFNCNILTMLDVSNFNTSNVKDMGNMFSECSSLTSLDLSSFDTSNVTDMEFMFGSCSGLTSLDLSRFNTSSVTDMGHMFSGCRGLTSLNLSSFETSSVTNMASMFSGCRGLTSLDLSSFDTSNVKDMCYLFSYCNSLTSLDLGNFNTSNVFNMVGMFYGCMNLMTIYVDEGKWSTASVTAYGNQMFVYCSALVGGKGTVYDVNHTNYTYARIDGGEDAPGYLTEKLENVPIIVSTAKQVAYCSNQNLDFSDMNELKAYVATGYDKTTGTIWLSRVYDVPAHTGFLLIGDAGTHEIPVSDKGSTSYYKNMFKGTLTGTTIQTTDGDYTNYYLSNGKDGVGFYKVGEKGVKLPANRAYLPIPTVIEAVGEAGSTVPVSVGGAEQVPYYSDQSLDFTTMEEKGMKAYTATGYDYSTGTIWLSRVKQVPAETGILIMAPKGDYDVPTASVASVYGNMFKGTLGGTTILTEEDGFINYYLSNGKDGVGFYKVTKEEGVALGKNRCYLQIPKVRPASSSRGGDASQISADLNSYSIGTSETIGIQLLGSTGGNGEGTTNIRESVNTVGEPDAYYNLQGQRVDNPTKGLYISKGKKVIVR